LALSGVDYHCVVRRAAASPRPSYNVIARARPASAALSGTAAVFSSFAAGRLTRRLGLGSGRFPLRLFTRIRSLLRTRLVGRLILWSWGGRDRFRGPFIANAFPSVHSQRGVGHCLLRDLASYLAALVLLSMDVEVQLAGQQFIRLGIRKRGAG
jgi:hypothetical protein